LIVTAIFSVVFAYVAARYPTMQRYNEAKKVISQLSTSIAWRMNGARWVGHPDAGLFNTGFSRRRDVCDQDDDGRTFDIVVEGRESRFFYGVPIVEVTWAKVVGSQPMNPVLSQELCAEIKKQFPDDVKVVIKSQERREEFQID